MGKQAENTDNGGYFKELNRSNIVTSYSITSQDILVDKNILKFVESAI